MMEETMPASPNTVHCQEIPRFQREIYSHNLQLPKTFDSNFFTHSPAEASSNQLSRLQQLQK